jgi:hypothetical protein
LPGWSIEESGRLLKWLNGPSSQISNAQSGYRDDVHHFLFYTNLLMGEFEGSNERGKTWAYAFADIFTLKNFAIAVVFAAVGFTVFESLRKKMRSQSNV